MYPCLTGRAADKRTALIKSIISYQMTHNAPNSIPAPGLYTIFTRVMPPFLKIIGRILRGNYALTAKYRV